MPLPYEVHEFVDFVRTKYGYGTRETLLKDYFFAAAIKYNTTRKGSVIKVNNMRWKPIGIIAARYNQAFESVFKKSAPQAGRNCYNS